MRFSPILKYRFHRPYIKFLRKIFINICNSLYLVRIWTYENVGKKHTFHGEAKT